METTTNKEVALGLSTAIMTGKWDQVDALLDENFAYIGDGRPVMNKQEYVFFMKNVLCTAMTDMDMKFPRVVCEGDMVAVDYTNEMTHSGTFYGAPATGKRVMGSGQFMREVKNGKVTAEWQTTNAVGLMGQLGLLPPQGK
jgi:predicted ester cyclase